MRKTKPLILPPTEGVSYLMDSTYLSNEKNGKWPSGPAELYIFVERWRGDKRQYRFVYTISAPDEDRALDQLREIASRPDITLIEEATRKVVPKDFLDSEQTASG